MPIRINLLAEQLHLEEERRKDPVKRAALLGVVIAACVGGYCAFLQLRILNGNNALGDKKSEYTRIEKRYKETLEASGRIKEIQDKLDALHSLATNRFLWAPPLDALQYSMIENVQVSKLTTVQQYTVKDGTPASTNKNTLKVTPAVRGAATEEIVLMLEGKDYGKSTDENHLKFLQSIASQPYFKSNLPSNAISLVALSPPTIDPETDRSFVVFTLSCTFPKRVR